MILKEPEQVYRNYDAISYHKLADFKKSPKLYEKKHVLKVVPKEKDTPEFRKGRAVHCMALEGLEEFSKRYAIGGPINKGTGKCYGVDTQTYAEWFATTGMTEALTNEENEHVLKIVQGLKSNKIICNVLAQGMSEMTCRIVWGGLAIQGRMDWLHPNNIIVDLKTCDDLDWFEADARKYSYAYQMAFYRWLYHESEVRNVEVCLIAVEKKEPFRAGLWKMPEGLLNHCQEGNMEALKRLKVCKDTGFFPTGFEAAREFQGVTT